MNKIFIMVLLVFAQAASLRAETDITFIAGYRAGGEFEEANTGAKLNIGEGESYAITIDIKSDANTWVQILYSHQETRLENDAANPQALLELDVDYLHVGGVYEWPGKVAQPFIVGTLGATYFNPDTNGADDVIRASIGFGGGVRLRLTEHVGMKLEARGFTTFLDTNGGMFCTEGGCRVVAASSTLWQSELRAGLSFRF